MTGYTGETPNIFVYYGISCMIALIIMQKQTVRKSTSKTTKSSRGGRPRKFSEPSRPITVTLPDRTLRQLTQINSDRAKAIAKAVSLAVAELDTTSSAAEIIKTGSGVGLVMVGPSRYLKDVSGLRMVEIMPNRHLLTIASGTSPASVEVELLDIIERVPQHDFGEIGLLTKLAGILRSTRQSSRIKKEEVLLVDADSM